MKATRAPYTLVSNQSTAANYTSPAYSIFDIDLQAIQVNYSGSPSGSFSIQGSVDGVSYATLFFIVNGTLTSTVAVPANPSPIIFDMFGSAVQYIQVVYTGSGTGSFSALVTGKRLGD